MSRKMAEKTERGRRGSKTRERRLNGIRLGFGIDGVLR